MCAKMNLKISFTILLAAAFIIFSPVFPQTKKSATVKLVLTSNLGGGFSTSTEDQETSDKIIQVFRTVRKETSAGAVYFDLGNGLYPGALSKYSYGSAMVDFFKYTGCRGTLVSSKDFMLGGDNISFLSKTGKVTFLSANIFKDNDPLFVPYDIIESGGLRIAVVGMSSSRVVVGTAERDFYKVKLLENRIALKRVMGELENKNIDATILLSGLRYGELFDILREFPQIGFVISGGDNRGDLLGGLMKRVELDDSRTVIFLPSAMSVYSLSLKISDKVSVKDIRQLGNVPKDPADTEYSQFMERITGWKNHYRKDAESVSVEIGDRPIVLDQVRVGDFMRDRFNTEISLVRDPVIPSEIIGNIKLFDVLSLIVDNYPVYTCEISGSELKKITSSMEDVIIRGKEGTKIQGYEIEDKRRYRAAVTQPVYDDIERFLARKLNGTNTWSDLSSEITADSSGEKKFYSPDFGYLDSKIRLIADINLSFFRESASVSRGENMSTPTGMSETKYKKIGTEDRIDLTVYNRHHRFVLTPYIFYVRQDELYLQNIFRCTALYTFNYFPIISPYNKFQLDTQLVKTEGLRPTIIRETTGLDFKMETFTGRLGVGFEKETKDPVGPYVYGIETIVKYKKVFFTSFTYSLSADSFVSINRHSAKDKSDKQGYWKMSIDTSLSYSLNEKVMLALKYKWYNYYSMQYRERYRNTQVITSIDVKTDFKIW